MKQNKYAFPIVLSLALICLAMCSFLGRYVAAEGMGGFDFTLPDGMFIPEEDNTGTDCPIVCAGQRIGGFIRTELEPSALIANDMHDLVDYLQQYVPEGLVYEYMGGGSGIVDMSFILVDPNTIQHREFKHWFFEKDGSVYDLWLDTRYVDGETECSILVTSGINPGLETIQIDAPVPNFDFDLPEDFTLGQPEGDSCPILLGDLAVGGFRCTDLPVKALAYADDLLDMEPYNQCGDSCYADNSFSEFAIHRDLARSLSETESEEYIMMYSDETGEDAFVSVSYRVTDSVTGEARESNHTFFQHDGIVYDLWLDYTLLDRDIPHNFLRTARGN